MVKLSVVMSTYNRAQILLETVNSVLNQSFADFEFIIIDDSSTDNTNELIKNINDNRIRLYKNIENRGCTFNYHTAQNLANGKYIVHIDDDDISLPDRFKIQYNYMEENKNVALSGTFIETFGENARPSWVFYTDSDLIDFSMNIYNPICHSSVIYRKSFMELNNINYNMNYICSQDYELYMKILENGGKITNIADTLVKYRMHSDRLTDNWQTQQIQINNAEKVKKRLLSRMFNLEEIEHIMELLKDFPFNNYNAESVLEAVDLIAQKNKYKDEIIQLFKEDVKSGKYKF